MKPEELKERRVALGYGPVDFARAVGVCYETVWKWEAGKSPIPTMLERLLAYMENNNGPREN